MITTNSGFDTLARSDAYGQLALVELNLRSGTVRYTNWQNDVQVMGQTWQGVGGLGSVGQLHESEDGAEEKLSLKLSPVDLATRALALVDPNEYKDRPMRLWVCVLDPLTYVIAGAPVLRFAGVMDVLSIERDGASGSIGMECRTASYDVRSNPAALRMNNSQHQARHPGERGFEYLTSLIGNPAVWVSKNLQARLNEIARAKG